MELIVVSDVNSTIGTFTNIAKKNNAKMTHFKNLDDYDQVINSIGPKSILVLDWDTFSEGVGQIFMKSLMKARSFTDTPVFALLAKQHLDKMDKDSRGALYDVISKPIDIEEVETKIKKALKPVGSHKSVDVSYINPFVNATLNVFETMAQTKAVRKELFLKKDYKMYGDISGVMGLSGTASGSVVISLTKSLAKTLVGRMLMDENVADSDVRDGIGEIINMISGQAKAALANTKHHFSLSLPTVVSGHGHEISHKKGTPCIVVVFQAENQKFAIQVSLASEAE